MQTTLACLPIAMLGLVAALSPIIGQSARAADIPKPVYKAAPAVVVTTWTGCYIGGQVGGAWSDTSWQYRNINPYNSIGPAGPILAANQDFDASSWIAGGQVGCNYEFANRWVIGVEGSWTATDLKQTKDNVVQIFAPSLQSVTTEIKSIATITGRLGYSTDPAWLIYAKGGYARGRIETSGRTSPPMPGLDLDWDTSSWHNGWIIGGGVEYRLWRNVIVGVEYGYVRLNEKNHVGAVSGGAITAANQVEHGVDADIHSVVARISYLFN